MLAQVGGTIYSNPTLDESGVQVVGAPVLLFNIMGYNSGGSVSFLQFFDALLADVTVGTTTPDFIVPLPATGGYDSALTLPESFRTGIVIACTATPTGNGAPAADALVKLSYTAGG